MSEPSSRAWTRRGLAYMLAVAVALASAAVQYWLQPVLGDRFGLAVFPIGVLVMASLGGVGPGLLTTLVSVLLADYYFLPPLRTLRIERQGDLVGLALVLLVSVSICIAVRRMQRTVRRERSQRADVEHALRRTGALEAVARAVSGARTVGEMAHACLAELLPATGATAGAVAIVNDEETHLNVVQALGYADPGAARRYAVALGATTIMTEVIRRQTPIVFGSRDERRNQFSSLSVDSILDAGEAVIVIPLLVSGRAIGIVALTYAARRDLDGAERAFLTGATQRTAQGLDRAMRYERAERARADLEAYRTKADIELRERQRAEAALRESEARYRALAARTRRLYTLSAGLSEAVTLDAVAKVVVRHGKVVVGAAAGSVALLSDGRHFETPHAFEMLHAEEYPPQLLDAWHRFPATAGLCETAAVSGGRPILVGSFDEWHQQYPRSASMAADGGYVSAAVLPLLVDNAAIGVLSFHFTAPVNFDEGYRAVLTSVAQHAAQAIDRARAYDAAQRARAEAEAANRSKDDFLSIVSHELRTPLSAVLGWAAMLKNQTLDPSRATRAIEAIYSNATRQAQLIDELLDVSRIVAGRAPLDLQEVDLAENVRGAVETIMPLAEAKGLRVQIVALPALRIAADPRRLEQVLVNLLGNAVKFTPEGGTITVEVSRSERSVDIRVQDTGRGIDPAFLPHVFERFRQADSTAARAVGGLGLGLFIARCLVDAHGGRIRVDSEGEDRGSTFIVSLPAPSATLQAPRPYPETTKAAPAAAPASLPSLAGLRVLLVDDEPDAREVMASALEVCGADVLSAGSVDEALAKLAGVQNRIDVLLSDIAMPGKDGYELIRHIRAQSNSALAGVPAAAVTAHAGADERQRALSAGFQMHLAKPLRPEALMQAVAALARTERVGAARRS